MLKKIAFYLNHQTDVGWAVLFTLIDVLILNISICLAAALFSDSLDSFVELKQHWEFFPLLTIVVVTLIWLLKIPNIKLESFDIDATKLIALITLLLILSALLLAVILGTNLPAALAINIGIIFFLGAVLIRIYVASTLKKYLNVAEDRLPIAIYGAGEAGMQLASALMHSKQFKPIVFIDDSKRIQKLKIFGLSVRPPGDLNQLVRTGTIKQILISIPSLKDMARDQLLEKLKHLDCPIKIVPSHVDIIQRRNLVESLVEVRPDTLLDRDKSDLHITDAKIKYYGKSILVSGAGGSIGLELCRQILKYSPKKLVLFEQSELALYTAELELREAAKKSGTALLPILGSVCDPATLKHLFEQLPIHVVFHAAAYKHVNLVEQNEIEGIKTNVLGTYRLASQAVRSAVDTFVLISTDKAVRPTNIMGSSKRLAEIIIHHFNSISKTTTFSMVRFGNVLGSSGSVIPLFKRQIADGGPVTITHKDVSRYFMAISEAAHLVIVAGSFAKGGELFVLDMGAPIKIKSLAERLIRKSGYSVKDKNNPNGDIKITTIGLRPGEKLEEELLINAKALFTPHHKIMIAHENFSEINIKTLVSDIEVACQNYNTDALRRLLDACMHGDNNNSIDKVVQS